MKLDIKKAFFLLFNKESLLSLLIFSLISIANTYSFYLPNLDNGFGMIILYLITTFLLLGYIIETVHIAILNNDEKIKLPDWNINILRYFKHSFLIIIVIIIYQLILVLISFALPLTFETLNAITISIVFPLVIVVYSKNYKIQEALDYKLYFNIIKKNFIEFLVLYVLTTIFYVGIYIIFDISKVLFMSPSMDYLYDYFVYLFGGFVLISSFIFILFYSQIYSEKQEVSKN